eukprot:1426136-Alexandrium_andersonii.AAC.1
MPARCGPGSRCGPRPGCARARGPSAFPSGSGTSGRCTGWSWLAAGWPRRRLPGPAVVPCAGPVP